jgi:hypothetical protein
LVFLLLLTAMAAVVWHGVARADGLGGYVEFSVVDTDTRTEDRIADITVDQPVRSFLQTYRLDFIRHVYPNLSFGIGGSYGWARSTTDLAGLTFSSVRTLFTPYARITLHNPVFGVEAGYDRREESVDAGVSSSKLVQDTWRANFSWSPVDLPLTRLDVSKRNTYDQNRAGLDVVEDRVQLSSRYLAIDKLDLFYQGSVEKDQDKLNDGELTSNFQNARVAYADSWYDRRLAFSADYTVNYRSSESTRSGTGEVIEPVAPTAGLSSLDDTPLRDPLASAPALIDADKAIPAGINLGLPGPGGDTRLRNFGVDLGFANEINTILVWVNQDLPPSIASVFTWQVYTSDNNLDWVLHQVLSSAPFGPFDDRFEVRFDATTSRYVKLVVAPLNPSVPDATSWPDIQVTELEPQIARPSSDLTFASSRTSQVFDTDFRALLVKRANLYYEMSYFLATQSPGAATWTLSNGFSVSQALSPIMTAAARLSREDAQLRVGRDVQYLFSGSLTATPVPAFQTSTVVSYVQEQGAVDVDRGSVTLNGIAQLYRGISANLALSKSRVVPNDGPAGEFFDVNFGLTLAPNDKLTLNAIVQNNQSTVDSFGPSRPAIDDTRKTAELSLAYRPWRSLYLFGSETWNRSSLSGSRTLRNASVTWTPFPDGTFHFGIFYDTSYQTDLDETQETLVPSIRWDITSKIYLNLAYQYLRSDSPLGINRTESASATIRAAF